MTRHTAYHTNPPNLHPTWTPSMCATMSSETTQMLGLMTVHMQCFIYNLVKAQAGSCNQQAPLQDMN
eukprot:CAMPEP_0119109106 /NCGR_PEP_ID=MMETSP1180-20130426/17246_1 /TAXON_ID=3052 ORGANISM="Chlamydomonas cf sp, Strain CCMP681" /NCGR_SAMPLE_ID=MMETSP1180 /ASSEMBLY_ACC=CAM_ASM_000741 /LENGTH=66 /DNA_ID=CAMNT_0007094819 /DNA_START=180 /DNA_END=380 /DNA_ORIENTATION=-